MKKRKNLVAAACVFALVLVIALAGYCLKNGGSMNASVHYDEKEYRIAMISPNASHPIWLDAKYGAEKAGDVFNANITWKAVDGVSSDASDEMVRYMEEAIDEGYDAIIVYPANPSKFENVLQKAKDAQIPVFFMVGDAYPQMRVAYVGTDTKSFGETAAELIAHKMGGQANLAIIMSRYESVNQAEEVAAFQAVVEENYPGIRIVTVETNQSDAIITMDVTQNILQEHPEVDCIWVVEGGGGPGAASVLQQQGLTDSVTLLGTDGSDDMIAAIEDGSAWGTIVQDFYSIGYLSVQYSVTHLKGESIPDTTDSGTIFVSAENVRSFQESLEEKHQSAG